MPKVSVLIPSYNHSQFINPCIDSVLAQTFQDLEIVVVDDGSTDGSLDILRQYNGKITLIEQANFGTQAARNKAIAASSGELLALLDSDDMWLPRKLELQVAELDRHPEAGLVYSFACRVDETGETIDGNSIIGQTLRSDQPVLSQMLLDDPVPALTAVFRRSCLDESQGFDDALFGSADWDMWLQIAARWNVICIPEPLALYREHENNTIKVLFRNRSLYKERCALISKTIERYPEQLSEQDRGRAWARADLLGAQIEIRSGNARAGGEYLAHALTHDPHIAADQQGFVQQIVDWTNLYFTEASTGAVYRRFIDELFEPLRGVINNFDRLRREVLSEVTMGVAFRRFDAGDFSAVRSVLPVGVTANPAWLSNRGVWSLGIKSFLAGLRPGRKI